jgi:hypothetical protein
VNIGRQRNSLKTKLLDYFKRNPDEELNYSDLQVKTGAPLRSIYSRVNELAASGELEVVTIIRRPLKATAK